MKKAFSNILLVLNWFAVITLFLSYISVYIPPDKLWPPAFFGMAFIVIVAANFLFILFWLVIKPKYLWLSLISVLVGFGFLSRYFQIGGKSGDLEGIRVISYNVRHFAGYGEKNPKENAANIVSFLNERQPDIICLQEARLRRNSIFDLPKTVKNIKSIQHYQYASSSTSYGLVTMTRFKIINMKEIRFENSRNMAIYTDVLVEKDTVRIFNVHLQSYKINPDSYSIIESQKITEEKELKEVREMGGKLKRAFQVRARQVREIRKSIDESPYPVILCGDFNDTPVSYSYQKMKGDLKDAFVGSGSGFGGTYMGKLPSFRIDFIFHSNTFKSFNFNTNDFKMSDHLPVSCDLVLKKTTRKESGEQ